MESKTDIRRIHTVNNFLKDSFGEKIIKLSLDGGFTCPNRDGTKSTDGCSFCSAMGSGELATRVESLHAIDESVQRQISLLSTKWPKVTKYLAYFQNYTNTYAPVDELREKFEKALEHPSVVGLAIATRPDCINEEVLDLLEELNSKTFLWVELGLQTYHDSTADYLNRCYPTHLYEEVVSKLLDRDIKVVCHLILGLPGETEEDMLHTVTEVCKPYSTTLPTGEIQRKRIFGIKLHLLNLVKGSKLAITDPDYVSFNSIDHYTDTVVNMLRYIPWEITIHRLTADVPRKLLLTPTWSYEKLTILNSITKKMRERNIIQGGSSKD